MTDPIVDFQALIRWADDWPLDDDIERALREDLGRRRHDITSESMIDPQQTGVADVVARAPGVVCGLVLIREVILHASAAVEARLQANDGDTITAGSPLVTLRGPLRDILRVERTMLNYLTLLSGVATATRRFVEQVQGTGAVICDTRKTLPGLRWLQKYAVRCGGGTAHRSGLHDAVLIKDNHLAHLRDDELTARITAAATHARRKVRTLRFVEVEIDRIDQLPAVLGAPVDMVLLDNMAPATIREAVALRDRLNPAVRLEASGGITLDTVRAVAETGVDRISVGAITHSAPALDLGLDITPGPIPAPPPHHGLPNLLRRHLGQRKPADPSPDPAAGDPA